MELTVKYFISHVFTWCLKIIPFLSPYSHLDIVHRLIYLWSLKVSPYLLRLISPVLCVLCNPVWLNVHICFTSFHASFHSTSALLINIKVVSCSDFFISILSASFPLVCKFLCELFNAWEFVLALSISALLFLLFFHRRQFSWNPQTLNIAWQIGFVLETLCAEWPLAWAAG